MHIWIFRCLWCVATISSTSPREVFVLVWNIPLFVVVGQERVPHSNTIDSIHSRQIRRRSSVKSLKCFFKRFTRFVKNIRAAHVIWHVSERSLVWVWNIMKFNWNLLFLMEWVFKYADSKTPFDSPIVTHDIHVDISITNVIINYLMCAKSGSFIP